MHPTLKAADGASGLMFEYLMMAVADHGVMLGGITYRNLPTSRHQFGQQIDVDWNVTGT